MPTLKINKWESIFALSITNRVSWSNIFLAAKDTTVETKLHNFHLKFIHRIIATNSYLFKVSIKDDKNCTFCQLQEESVEHLFYVCPFSNRFWQHFWTWLKSKSIIDQNHSMEMFDILLYCNKVNECTLLNQLLLIGKYYIYTCKIKNKLPEFEDILQRFIPDTRAIELQIANHNETSEKFNNKWLGL